MALRGEGGFGFVDEVESAGGDAGLCELEKAFAVREVVEVTPVAGVDGVLVALHVATDAGVVLVFVDVSVEGSFEFLVASDEVEEVLGSEEEAFSVAFGPAQSKGFGQGSDLVEGAILVDGGVAHGDALGCDCDRFE